MLEIIRNAEDAKLIELRIVQWGKWVRVGSRCDGARGINPIAAMMDKVNPSASYSPMISDDEAEFIGDAVMVLTRTEPELGDAVVNYYVTRAVTNLTTLARDLGCSRTMAGERVNRALGWLQGYFCGALNKPDKAVYLKAA